MEDIAESLAYLRLLAIDENNCFACELRIRFYPSLPSILNSLQFSLNGGK